MTGEVALAGEDEDGLHSLPFTAWLSLVSVFEGQAQTFQRSPFQS